MTQQNNEEIIKYLDKNYNPRKIDDKFIDGLYDLSKEHIISIKQMQGVLNEVLKLHIKTICDIILENINSNKAIDDLKFYVIMIKGINKILNVLSISLEDRLDLMKDIHNDPKA